jgi:hypothetical protein
VGTSAEVCPNLAEMMQGWSYKDRPVPFPVSCFRRLVRIMEFTAHHLIGFGRKQTNSIFLPYFSALPRFLHCLAPIASSYMILNV